MNFPEKRSEFREWQNSRNNDIQNFIQNRQNCYGPLGKQLDMLWHDIDNNIIPGKNGEFYNYIKLAKLKILKPNFDIVEYQNYDFSKKNFIEDLD